MVEEYIDHKRCSECEGTFINYVNIVLPSVLSYLPANISSNSYRTAEECKESTLATSRAPSCESGVEGIASAAKDMIVRFSPLTFGRKRKCGVVSKFSAILVAKHIRIAPSMSAVHSFERKGLLHTRIRSGREPSHDWHSYRSTQHNLDGNQHNSSR